MYTTRKNHMRTFDSLWFLLAALAIAAAQPASADVIILGAQKDNTLIEEPNGSLSNGAGQHLSQRGRGHSGPRRLFHLGF